jgi:hypothetical protein
MFFSRSSCKLNEAESQTAYRGCWNIFDEPLAAQAGKPPEE